MSPQLAHPGRLGRPRRGGGGESFDPTADPGVMEIYNALDESKHTYYAAREITQIACDSGLAKATVSCAGHGFLNGDVAFLAGGLGAFPNLAGAQMVIATPSADIFEIAQGEYDGTEVYEAPLPTTDWEDRRPQVVAGMKGIWNASAPSLSAAPFWNAAVKELYGVKSRQTRLDLPSAAHNAFNTASSRAIGVLYRKHDGIKGGLVGGNSYTNGRCSVVSWGTNSLSVNGNDGVAEYGWSISNPSAIGTWNLVFAQGDGVTRSGYANDMETDVRSSDGKWVGGGEIRAFSILLADYNQAGPGHLNGAVNYVVFFLNGLPDVKYRKNTKAMLEAMQGVTFG